MKRLTTFIVNENSIAGFVLALVCLAILLAGIVTIAVFDGDPTIYLAYAKNIAHGDFFSFNPGEFSSGSTSPLWAMVLSLAFLLPSSVTLSKIIGLAVTLLALFATYRMSLVVSKSKIGSAIGVCLMLYFLAHSGLAGYESSLAVCLVSAAIILTHEIIHRSSSSIGRHVVGLALIWSAIPLVRPDAFAVVAANLLILAFVFIKDKRSVRLLVAAFLLSLLPSIVYFGYSYVTLGTFSTSASGRAFMMAYGAPTVLGISYSLAPIGLLLSFPLFLWIGLALWGWEKIRRHEAQQWFACFSAILLVGYLLLFSVVLPVGKVNSVFSLFSLNDPSSLVSRYLLPAITFVVPLASIGVAELWKALRVRKYVVFSLALSAVLVLWPLTWVTEQAVSSYIHLSTFNEITEKAIVEHINAIAEANATVLMNEVQDRYYLRPDLKVLSQDGITDGKIAPYLASGDVSSFLLKYRPGYWLANNVQFGNSFFSRSILRQVVDQIGETEGASIQIDGITFTNIRKNEVLSGARYTQLYRLTYTGSSP